MFYSGFSALCSSYSNVHCFLEKEEMKDSSSPPWTEPGSGRVVRRAPNSVSEGWDGLPGFSGSEVLGGGGAVRGSAPSSGHTSAVDTVLHGAREGFFRTALD